jgi:hypothetical protein
LPLLFRRIILSLFAVVAMALSADAADRVSQASNNIQAVLEAARRSPRGKAFWSATKFFICTLGRNRIPDCKASEEGSFTTDMGPLNDFGAVTFPVSFTFQLTKRGESALYCYTVQKDAWFSRWHFTKAWKQTKTGKRLAELSLPK